jgi:hypothetical protein
MLYPFLPGVAENLRRAPMVALCLVGCDHHTTRDYVSPTEARCASQVGVPEVGSAEI